MGAQVGQLLLQARRVLLRALGAAPQFHDQLSSGRDLAILGRDLRPVELVQFTDEGGGVTDDGEPLLAGGGGLDCPGGLAAASSAALVLSGPTAAVLSCDGAAGWVGPGVAAPLPGAAAATLSFPTDV